MRSCFLQEIGGYAWHRIADLPATRDEGNQTFMSEDGAKHKFYMVSQLHWAYQYHLLVLLGSPTTLGGVARQCNNEICSTAVGSYNRCGHT